MRANVGIDATLVVVLSVVLTPPDRVGAFAAFAALIGVAASLAGFTVGQFLKGLAIELPFVAFALLLPIIGVSPRVDVIGLSLSEPGLLAAWNILAKATLAVGAVNTLRRLCPPDELIDGLQRLKVPLVFVSTMSFMLRYSEVLRRQVVAMTHARQARGDDPRWLWQGGAIARSSGTLFVRSFERSERVQRAMQARGFDGSLDAFGAFATARPARWPLAIAYASLAIAIAVTARIVS